MLAHGDIPKLKITIDKNHIATLFYDEENTRYGLTYYKALEKVSRASTF